MIGKGNLCQNLYVLDSYAPALSPIAQSHHLAHVSSEIWDISLQIKFKFFLNV